MKSLTLLQKILSGTSLAALMLLSTLPASGSDHKERNDFSRNSKHSSPSQSTSAASERESFVMAAVMKAREEAQKASIEKTGLVATRPELNLIGIAARAAAEKEFDNKNSPLEAAAAEAAAALSEEAKAAEAEAEAAERVQLSSQRESFVNAAVKKAREEAQKASIEKTGLVATRPELNLIGNAARDAVEQQIESINKKLAANADSLADMLFEALTSPTSPDSDKSVDEIARKEIQSFMSAAEIKFFNDNNDLFSASMRKVSDVVGQKMEEFVGGIVASIKSLPENQQEKALENIQNQYRPYIVEKIKAQAPQQTNSDSDD